MQIDRRVLLGGALGFVLPASFGSAFGKPKSKPKIAITIDDFALPSTGMMPVLERDAAIRRTLKRHRVKAAGFVAGMRIDNADGEKILQSWSDDGHILGNHSYSHRYFGKQDVAEYWQDVAKCEALLIGYPSFRKLLRFPYLGEGTSVETRDAMRRKMEENGYRNGVVTIDASDWYIDQRMGKRIKEKPQSTFAAYGQYYVDHLWDRAQYYEHLAQATFGASIPHTLLIHHNDITALFLDDALNLFKRKGWKIISAEEAYRSAALQKTYDSMPSGQSLIWAAAKVKNLGGPLRYPAENGDYEAVKMDAIGL